MNSTFHGTPTDTVGVEGASLEVAPRLPGDPAVTVIVTCYNYGHFVEACLDSVLGQRRLPDQIIVVDDGSTDDTAAILRRYEGRIEVITTPNAGQAAAFNAGFAAASGDMILFLDADDMLRPEAMESLLYRWSDDLAVLTFGLETVEASGRSTGLCAPSIEADRGDNRPRLLRTGTFNFPPTSGNVFSRWCLQRVLPMPEKQWRISADSYLIRAAALLGRFDHAPQVLGSYRIHGTNNYANGIDETVDLARHRSNLADVARALSDLAEEAERFSSDPADAAALRRALRHRTQACLAEATGSSEPAPAAAHRFRPSVATSGRTRRPAPAGSGAPDILACSRWPSTLPLDEWIDLENRGPYRDAVISRLDDPSPFSPATSALVFCVCPSPGILWATLKFRVDRAGGASLPMLEILVAGEAAWRGVPDVEQTVQFAIPRAQWDNRQPIRIDFGFAPRSVGTYSPGPLPRLFATSLRLSTTDEAVAYPYLGEDFCAIGDGLEASLDGTEWAVDERRWATLQGLSGQLRFSAVANAPSSLCLAFDPLPPRGWLHIRSGELTLFTGWLGQSSRLVVPLPTASRTVAAYDLSLHFDRSDPSGDRLRIADVAVRAMRVDAPGLAVSQFGVPLNLGETVFFGRSGLRSALLASGWEEPEESSATNAGPEAVIAFRVPENAANTSLLLSAEPAFEAPPNTRHVLGVSQGGVLCQVVELAGAGQVEVPFAVEDRHQDIALVIHSSFVPDEPTGSVAMAPFMLTSLELRGTETGAVRLPRAPRPAKPALRVLLDELAGVLDTVGDAQQRDRQMPMRARLVVLLGACADKACLLLLASERDVGLLVRLGEVTAGQGTVDEEEVAFQAAQHRAEAGDPAAMLRLTLISFLIRPAFCSPVPTNFGLLPGPLFWRPEALARYFGQAPDICDEGEHRQYFSYLERLLREVDRVLARKRRDSAQFKLAAATLQVMRSTRVIFGRGVMRDLIRLRSRCIERLLTRSDARLAVGFGQRLATNRLRIGVFVRDVLPNPEGWALLGCYAGLDAEAFDAVLIRLEDSPASMPPPHLFRETLCLEGLSVTESVAAIRALDLDLFLDNCYVADWEKASAIVAHRLAPLQIWLGAVGPSTSGLRSFDTVITCRATEPENPGRHYTERLSWLAGARQCAYAFPPFVPPDVRAVRADIGVASDAVLLVSGAMAHKITDPLLAIWADILAGAPDAVLVLYPFATNWSMDFAHERFRDRLDRQLDAAEVDRSRAVLLSTQRPERVRKIASAADLYLDSFPYTGATTVCEALSAGTPVLTCAGDALRELTGTSWVRAFDLPELVATSASEYRDIALDLCRNRDRLLQLRGRVTGTLSSAAPPHHDPQAFGSAFADALWRTALDSGRFPNLAPHRGGERKHVLMPSDIAPAPRPASFAVRSGKAPVKLAILASPRTGSTLLCDLLNQTSGILCHYELFHDDIVQFADRTERDADVLRARDADPLAFLHEIYAQGFAAGHGVVGFKHFGHLNMAVMHAVIADPTIKLIHIGRENRLAQYSSLKIAERSGKWFSRPGDAEDQQQMTFDAVAFETWEAYQNRVDSERLGLLSRSKRDVLMLDFDGVLDPATPDNLSRFLGVEIVRGGTPHFQRQNGPRILDRFTNRAEVAAYLAERGLSRWSEGG